MTELMGPEELEAALRAIGAARYHNRHPFHGLLHGGKLNRGQVQAWALNRYFYQSIIPMKDAAILSRATDRDFRRAWRQRVVDHDGGEEGDGGIERWLRLTDAVGFERDYVLSGEGLLPATRFAVEAYLHFVRERSLLEAVASSLTELFAPAIITERVSGMLANYDFIDRQALGYFDKRLAPGAARRRLRDRIREARSATAAPAESGPARRWNSSATCCGRSWTRSITPMSRQGTFRPVLFDRRRPRHDNP